MMKPDRDAQLGKEADPAGTGQPAERAPGRPGTELSKGDEIDIGVLRLLHRAFAARARGVWPARGKR